MNLAEPHQVKLAASLKGEELSCIAGRSPWLSSVLRLARKPGDVCRRPGNGPLREDFAVNPGLSQPPRRLARAATGLLVALNAAFAGTAADVDFCLTYTHPMAIGAPWAPLFVRNRSQKTRNLPETCQIIAMGVCG